MIITKKLINISYSKAIIIPPKFLKAMNVDKNSTLLLKLTNDNELIIKRWCRDGEDTN